MDEPVETGNKNPAKECGESPQATAPQKRFAAVKPPQEGRIFENRRGKTDVDYCGGDPKKPGRNGEFIRADRLHEDKATDCQNNTTSDNDRTQLRL